MKMVIRTLLGACVLASAPFVAQAQDVTHMLMPSNAWLVGPTTLAEGSDVQAAGVPCLMVTSFSNNYEVRISGGGQQIMAMALNFREKNFKPGESYLMTLSFSEEGGFEVAAQAFSEDTLVVGLSQEPEFYKRLTESESLYITLGEAKMQFSLLGVPQGLKRLEQCFQPSAADVRAAISSEAVDDGVAEGGLQTLGDGEIEALRDMVAGEENASAATDVTAEAIPDALPAIPEAAAEPAPATTASPAVEQKQVQDLRKVADTPPSHEARPRDILAPANKTVTAAEAVNPRMQWRVMKGGGLEGVLGVWSQSVNMRLIWKTDQSYSVPQSLSMQGTFEEVVQAVLEQFPADGPRPVGKIYLDPSSRQKVLLIETVVPAQQMPVEGAYEPILSPQ